MSSTFLVYFSKLFGQEQHSDCSVVFYCKSARPSSRSETGASEKRQRTSETEQESKTEGCPFATDPELVTAEGQRAAQGVAKDSAPPSETSSDDNALLQPDRQGQFSRDDVQPSAKRRREDEQQPAEQPDGEADVDVVVGAPLPAHLMALCGGSQRFSAQAERWTQQQPPGSKPVLRVPLEDEEDLPAALTALQFVYTGKLSDVATVSRLLRVRRLAAYLQVDGCVSACDAAIVSAINSSTGKQGEVGALACVLELYSARKLLSSAVVEPRGFRQVLRACREQLVKHGASGKIEGNVPEGTPSLGNLLGWAFGDAPSVLSDPATCRQMESLSATGMEALLGSETFTTDSEDTVLLMLATWLRAHPNTPDTTKLRLCKLIRLSQLSSTYLHAILPTLSWFPLSTEEHRFLCQYMSAPSALQAKMANMATGKYDCASPWYAAAARPAATDDPCRSYDWCVRQVDMRAELAKGADKVWMKGQFSNGAERVVAQGFEWYPGLFKEKAESAMGVFLYCTLPAALRSTITDAKPLVAVNTVSARLVVYKRPDQGAGSSSSSGTNRNEAYTMDYAGVYVQVANGWGTLKALRPAEADTAGAQGAGAGSAPSDSLLAPWAAYLIEGKVCGVLEWTGS